MTNIRSFSLSCVTISRFFDSEFVRTIHSFYESIHSNLLSRVQLIVVISRCERKEVLSFLEANIPKLSFILIDGADTSLYNAMNIGIERSSGRYLFFLNAGDFVCNSGLLSTVINTISPHHTQTFCYAFSAIQKYQEMQWLRPAIHNSFFLFRPMLPPHQGMIIPNSRATPRYNETLPLTADSEWIRKVLSIYPTLYSNSPLVVFSLGGLSNLPSLRLVSLRLEEKNYLLVPVELIKYILFLLLPPGLYYRFLFFLRGLRFMQS